MDTPATKARTPNPRWPFLAAGVGLTALITLLSFHRLAGVDVWYYMATGRWMLDHHAVPRQNLFMYTAPGFPWVDHPLLAQLAFLGLYRAGGVIALQAFVAAAGALSFGLLLWLWWRMGASVRLAPAPFLLAILLPVGRYTPRPEFFTDVLLAALVVLVLTWRELGHRWIWLAPALVAVWVNVHGGALSGVAFLLAFAGGETLQLALAKAAPAIGEWALPARRWRTLALVSVCSACALLLNPYGVHWFQAVSPAQIRFMAGHIEEWRPLLQPGLDLKVPLAVVFIFLAVAWASFVFRRGLQLGALAAAAVVTAMAFSSLRHLPICGFGLLAIMAVNLRHAAWPGFLARLAPAASRAALAAGLVFGAVVLGFALNVPLFHWLGAEQPLGLGIDADVQPVAAERFIREQRITGRMFNAYQYGGYLAWTRYPQRALFIDVLNAFGPAELGQYREIMSAGPRAEALIDRWRINYFLIEALEPASRPPSSRDIYSYLSGSPQWALVYWDAISMIYLRRAPDNADLIARHAYRYFDPLDPLSPANRQHPQQVAGELDRAIAANPRSSLLRAQAGRIFLQLGKPERAAEEFAAAIRLDPGSSDAYAGLGLTYLGLGALAEARTLFARAAYLAPNDPWSHRGLAQVAQAQGDWPTAAAEWARAARRTPESVGDRVALALALEAIADKRRAARAWREVLSLKPDAATAALAQEHLRSLPAGARP